MERKRTSVDDREKLEEIVRVAVVIVQDQCSNRLPRGLVGTGINPCRTVGTLDSPNSTRTAQSHLRHRMGNGNRGSKFRRRTKPRQSGRPFGRNRIQRRARHQRLGARRDRRHLSHLQARRGGGSQAPFSDPILTKTLKPLCFPQTQNRRKKLQNREKQTSKPHTLGDFWLRKSAP